MRGKRGRNSLDITDAFVGYFKSGETLRKRIGLELEHFVMKNGRPLSYENGVRDILTELSEGAKRFYENGYIIGCDTGDYTLTLEPAAQLEISVSPKTDTREIYAVLDGFYKKAEPVLKRYDATLKTIPTLSDELLAYTELIPKKRYEYMYRYFKTSGSMGRNMMCGSASVQISIDYESETDFARKFRLAYILSPVFAYLMSEDKAFRRIEIWDNTDSKRTYIPKDLFSQEFGYESYAKALLDVPAIFVGKNFTGERTIGEIAKEMPVTDELLEHFISMVFPDVRLKKYIEIRIADSTSFEKATEYAELLRVIFYTDALFELLKRYERVDIEDILAAKNSLVKNPEGIAKKAEHVLGIAEKYGFKRSLL